MTARLDGQGKVVISGGSDSDLSAGVVGVVSQLLGGLTPEQLLQVRGQRTVPPNLCLSRGTHATRSSAITLRLGPSLSLCNRRSTRRR